MNDERRRPIAVSADAPTEGRRKVFVGIQSAEQQLRSNTRDDTICVDRLAAYERHTNRAAALDPYRIHIGRCADLNAERARDPVQGQSDRTCSHRIAMIYFSVK